MIVLQILLQMWQNTSIRVGLSSGFCKFQHRFSFPKLFQTVFFCLFFGGGGGGSVKSVG